MSYPNTILYPKAFDRNKAAGFDGVFNWKWTEGLFGKTIKPMDFDGVVERHHHYLIFETKESEVEIPKGQLITLEHLHKAKSFCVMKIWGKNEPRYFEITFGYINGKIKSYTGNGVEEAKDNVKRWFEWANKCTK